MTSISLPGIALRLTLVVVLCGAIGMAAGLGFYSLAVAGSAVVLLALLVFRHIRTALLHRVQSDRFVLEVEVAPASLPDVLALVAEHGAVLESMDCAPEGELTAIRLHLRLAAGADRAVLVQDVQSHASVATAHAKRGLELIPA